MGVHRERVAPCGPFRAVCAIVTDDSDTGGGMRMKAFRSAGAAMLCAAVILFQFQPGMVNAEPPLIEGEYRASGTNPDGTAYTGVVTISKDGEMYRFHWRVGTEYYGHGTLKGDVLTVYWGAPEPVIYTVRDGGKTLEGLWAGGAATETLRR